MQTNYYKRGVVVGASNWGVSEYQDRAKELASDSPAPYVLVLLAKDGSDPSVVSAMSAAELAGYYSHWADNPAPYAYVYAVDKSKPEMFNEAFFTAVSQVELPITVTKRISRTQTGLGWILGGLAGGLGILAMTRHRHGS